MLNACSLKAQFFTRRTLDESVAILETFLSEFDTEEARGSRIKRDDSDRGVT